MINVPTRNVIVSLVTVVEVMEKNSKEIVCIECGEECHCAEENDNETCCTHCNCVKKAMDRDGSA